MFERDGRHMSATTDRAPSAFRRVASGVAGLSVVLGLIAGGVPTLLGFLAPWHAAADLANAMTPYTLAGFAVLSALAWGCGRSGLLRLSSAFFVLNLGLFLTPLAGVASRGPAAAGGAALPLKIVSFNLYWDGRDPSAIRDYLVGEAADIVVLQEADSRHRAALLPLLKSAYPHIVTCEGYPGCDLALLSKRPWLTAGVADVQDEHPLAVWARFEGGRTGAFIVATAHISWPLSGGDQMAEISDLVAWLRSATDPILIAGDFNATPWSFALRRLQWDSGLLRHATFATSWPVAGSFEPIPGPLFLIDHVLSSPEFSSLGLSTGPDLGSDHLPIVAHVQLH